MLIPAMLAALSVVREKELGSIINFYVTPVTRLEFLVAKQIPYIGLAMLNFLLLTLLAVTLLDVPLTGSFATLIAATLLYVAAETGMGVLKIGRATGRERGGRYVVSSGVSGTLKKKR